MAKRTKVRDYDQFIVRLPDGMRDRIKAKADRADMSMNEAIVWALAQHFPAPTSLADRVAEITDMVATMKQSGDPNADVDRLIDELDDTLRKIVDGKIRAAQDFKNAVQRRIEEWDQWKLEEASESDYDPFDDANYPPAIGDPGDPFADPNDGAAEIDPKLDPLAQMRKR